MSGIKCSYCDKTIDDYPSLEYNLPRPDGTTKHMTACDACNRDFGDFVFRRFMKEIEKEAP